MAFQGEKSIWLCADRRLTYRGRHADKACKILSVAGTDGHALLGYAGLGETLAETQPSEWMNDLLSDQPKKPLESYLGVIANAMQADMPPHLVGPDGPPAHHLLAPAVVNGGTRLYAVLLELARGAAPGRFVYTRYARTAEGGPLPRLSMASPTKFSRELSKIVRAVEAGRVNPLAVADRLARTNHAVSERESSGWQTKHRGVALQWRRRTVL